MRTITTTLIVVALVFWTSDAWAQRGGQRGGGQRGGGQRGTATQGMGGGQGQMGGGRGQSRGGQMQQGQGGQMQQGRGGQMQQGQRGQGQGGQGQRGQGQGGQGQRGRGQGQRGQGGQLTQVEADGLAYMKQEEKLARDVYLTLGETWNLKVFDNIAQAEARHMKAVDRLMTRYKVADPLSSDVRGEFADPRLSNLYRQLVNQGMQSREAALQVGVQIEKLDIADLQKETAGVTNPDIQRVYQNLMRGSMQHLRAFNSQLDR